MNSKPVSDLDLGATITVAQGFWAMFFFLREEYRRTRSDDLGVLLGSMQPATDDMPLDLASWEDWKRAVTQVLAESPAN